MSYTLFDLSTKSREELEAIAAEYALSNVKKLDNENLAYAILDAQANAAAQKPLPPKPKAKRGRPKKEAAPKADAPQAEKPQPENPAKPEKPVSRRIRNRMEGILFICSMPHIAEAGCNWRYHRPAALPAGHSDSLSHSDTPSDTPHTSWDHPAPTDRPFFPVCRNGNASAPNAYPGP